MDYQQRIFIFNKETLILPPGACSNKERLLLVLRSLVELSFSEGPLGAPLMLVVVMVVVVVVIDEDAL